VVQTGVKFALEPIFEKEFAEHSYGFRPGRGCKDALRRVNELLQQGNLWVVDADLKSYFDTIDHHKLMQRVEEKVADGRLLRLIRMYLEQGIMEDMNLWIPEQGTPQGAIISPLLANIFLNPLDHMMARQGMEMVRYADDFVIFCQSREQAEKALELVKAWTEEQNLKLHPEKTRIVDASVKGGFDFLGYHFDVGGKRWPRQKSEQKFKDAIRARTRRTNGNSMECIIEQINPINRGWYGYFKHSVKGTFRDLDGWIRGRLRSILRIRSKRQGRGRGADHQRWPNAYFAQAGLFSMYEARLRDAHPAQAVNH
jgi:RNA-directed DNA polymerase